MASKIQINGIRLGGIGQIWPGSVYDDVREAAFVALIVAGGGLLWDSADVRVAAASLEAQAARSRGASVSEAESIMQSAVQASQSASITGANTVDSTTSTVQTATTGVTTQSAGSATFTWGVHECFVYPPLAGVSLATVEESAATGVITAQPTHARTVDVTFDAGWQGGSVTIDGTAPNGTAQQEVYASTPGGTVAGVKAFATISAVTNGTLAGTADLATVKTGAQLAVGGPVDAFLFIVVDGVREAIAASSAVNGTFSATTALDGTQFVEVSYSQVHTLAAHTHTMSDAGHTHTGNSHTHTLS